MDETRMMRARDALLRPTSVASTRFTLAVGADVAAAAVERIALDDGGTDLQADEERRRLRFRMPQTIWHWEREVGVTIVPMRRGCEIEISLDVVPGTPVDTADAEKNAAALGQLQRQIELAVT